MRHVSPADLVDLAEGTRDAASLPHLAVCAICRQRVAELQATIDAVGIADIPEPSPLFWDLLSARVRQSIAADAGSSAPAAWLFGWRRWSALAAVGVVVVLAIVLLAPRPPVTGDAPVAAAPHVDQLLPNTLEGPALASDEPTLSLLAEFLANVDGDPADGWMPMQGGAADGEISRLSDAERTELRRLLREVMARAGA